MLKWFDTKESDDFARSLAKDIVAHIPLATLAEYKRGDTAKLAKSLHAMHGRVAKFQQANRLNFYKKAKVGNVLKWELKEAGYPEDFIDQIAKDVVVRLTTARSA